MVKEGALQTVWLLGKIFVTVDINSSIVTRQVLPTSVKDVPFVIR